MTNPLHPKTLPLLVALAMLTLPPQVLADPVCGLAGLSKRSAITELCPFKDGLARIQTANRWGFVDSAGNIAIAPQFDEVSDFSEGYAAAKRDEKWGVIDKLGKWVVEPTLEEVGPFSQGLAAAGRDGKTGYIDTAGKWVIAPTYAYAGAFSGAVAVANESYESMLLINRSGRVVKRFAPGMRVEQFVSKTGMFAASFQGPAQLLHVDGRKLPFPEGAANWTYKDHHFVATRRVTRGDKTLELDGLMDMAGEWVIAPKFKELGQFYGKLAIAMLDVPGETEGAGYGLVDRQGKFVVQPLYRRITRDDDGLFYGARAGLENKPDYFDANGKFMFALDCDAMAPTAKVGVLMVLSGCRKTWLANAQGALLATFDGEREVKVLGNHLLIENAASEEADRALAFEIYNGAGQRVAATDPAHKRYGEGADHVGLLAPGPAPRDPALTLPIAIYGTYSGGVTLLTPDFKAITRPDWQYDSLLLHYTISGEDSALEGPLVMKGADGFGAVDAKGNWIVPARFTDLGPFKHGVAFASLDGARVMVDSAGKTYPFPENGYRFARTAYMVVTGESDEGVVTFDLRTGALTTAPQAADTVVGKAVGGLAPIEKDGKWGLVNDKLAPVVAPAFDGEPTPLMHDEKLVGWLTRIKLSGDATEAYLYGLLDPEGRESIKPRYSELKLDDKTGMLIATEDDHLQSALSAAGQTLLPPIHGVMVSLGDGWFKAEPANLHGLVDQRGEWVAKPGRVEFELDNRYHATVRRPYAITRKVAQRQLVNHQGQISTRAAPRELALEEPSHWWWTEDDSDADTVFYGFNFKERARLAGKAGGDGFSEGRISFTPSAEQHSGKIGLADDKGKTIGVYDYAEIGPMIEGRAKVSKDVAVQPKAQGKHRDREAEPLIRYGFIDGAGKLAVPLVFKDAAVFSEQRATVITDGGLALIDTSGKVLLRGAWQCGRTAVLLDSKKNVLWPEEAKTVTKCSP